MAIAKWRQMRNLGLETATLSREIRRQAADSPDVADEDPSIQAAIAFRSICDQPRTFDVLTRYEARFERQYDRAWRGLLALKKTREMQNEPKPER